MPLHTEEFRQLGGSKKISNNNFSNCISLVIVTYLSCSSFKLYIYSFLVRLELDTLPTTVLNQSYAQKWKRCCSHIFWVHDLLNQIWPVQQIDQVVVSWPGLKSKNITNTLFTKSQWLLQFNQMKFNLDNLRSKIMRKRYMCYGNIGSQFNYPQHDSRVKGHWKSQFPIPQSNYWK